MDFTAEVTVIVSSPELSLKSLDRRHRHMLPQLTTLAKAAMRSINPFLGVSTALTVGRAVRLNHDNVDNVQLCE